jgi:RNA polymerase sigma-70 factor (ECF subfamily)
VITPPITQLRPDARADEMSDAGLVAACGAGDRAARALLFERHVDAIHGFVSRLRGSDSDAVDDVVQTTFVRAFQSAGGFHGASARSWLFGIAANVVREHVRRSIRTKRALSAVAELAPRTIGPRDPLVARLPHAIAELPLPLREVLVLVDIEGERGADAAAALGVPPGTLWRRLFEARTKLRELLDTPSSGGAS